MRPTIQKTAESKIPKEKRRPLLTVILKKGNTKNGNKKTIPKKHINEILFISCAFEFIYDGIIPQYLKYDRVYK